MLGIVFVKFIYINCDRFLLIKKIRIVFLQQVQKNKLDQKLTQIQVGNHEPERQ